MTLFVSLERHYVKFVILAFVIFSNITNLYAQTNLEELNTFANELITKGVTESTIDAIDKAQEPEKYIIALLVMVNNNPRYIPSIDKDWYNSLNQECKDMLSPVLNLLKERGQIDVTPGTTQGLKDDDKEIKHVNNVKNNTTSTTSNRQITILGLSNMFSPSPWVKSDLRDEDGNPVLWSQCVLTRNNEGKYSLRNDPKGLTTFKWDDYLFNTRDTEELGNDETFYRLPTYDELKGFLVGKSTNSSFIYAKHDDNETYFGMPYWLQGKWMCNNPVMDNKSNVHNSSTVFTIMEGGAVIADVFESHMVGIRYLDGKLKVGSLELSVDHDNHILTDNHGDVFVKIGPADTPVIGLKVNFKASYNSKPYYSLNVPEPSGLFMTGTKSQNNKVWAMKVDAEGASLVEADINTPMYIIPVKIQNNVTERQKWNQVIEEIAQEQAAPIIGKFRRSYPIEKTYFEDVEIPRDYIFEPLVNSNGSKLKSNEAFVKIHDNLLSTAHIDRVITRRNEIVDSALMDIRNKIHESVLQSSASKKDNPVYSYMQSLVDRIRRDVSSMFEFDILRDYENGNNRAKLRVLTTTQTKKIYSDFQKFLKKNATITYETATGRGVKGGGYTNGHKSPCTFTNNNIFYNIDPDGEHVERMKRSNPLLPSGEETYQICYACNHYETQYKLNGTDDDSHAYFSRYFKEIDNIVKSEIQRYIRENYPEFNGCEIITTIPLKNSPNVFDAKKTQYGLKSQEGNPIRIPFLQTDLDKGMIIYQVEA